MLPYLLAGFGFALAALVGTAPIEAEQQSPGSMDRVTVPALSREFHPLAPGPSPADDLVNAILSLAPGNPAQAASDEVSYPAGDATDRVLILMANGEGPATLRLSMSCRIGGDRQLLARVDGQQGSFTCGGEMDVAVPAGDSEYTVIVTAGGRGSTRIGWTLTAAVD